MDWIKSYADGGNTNYQYLFNLIKAFSDIKLKVILFAMTGRLIQGSEVRTGNVKCSAEEYTETIKKLEWLKSVIKPLSNLEGNRWAAECAVVWAYSDSEVDNNKLIGNITKYYSIATPISTIESALEQIEKIYNYKIRKKVYIKTNYLKSLDEKTINSRKEGAKRRIQNPQACLDWSRSNR